MTTSTPAAGTPAADPNATKMAKRAAIITIVLVVLNFCCGGCGLAHLALLVGPMLLGAASLGTTLWSFSIYYQSCRAGNGGTPLGVATHMQGPGNFWPKVKNLAADGRTFFFGGRCEKKARNWFIAAAIAYVCGVMIFITEVVLALAWIAK